MYAARGDHRCSQESQEDSPGQKSSCPGLSVSEGAPRSAVTHSVSSSTSLSTAAVKPSRWRPPAVAKWGCPPPPPWISFAASRMLFPMFTPEATALSDAAAVSRGLPSFSEPSTTMLLGSSARIWNAMSLTNSAGRTTCPSPPSVHLSPWPSPSVVP